MADEPVDGTEEEIRKIKERLAEVEKRIGIGDKPAKPDQPQLGPLFGQMPGQWWIVPLD